MVAKKLLEINFDTSFIHSYNTMLQSGRALMYCYGYRAMEEEGHKITIDFIESIIDEKYNEYLIAFDRMRRKRHIATYNEAGTITNYYANFAYKTAKEFIQIVKNKIKNRTI